MKNVTRSRTRELTIDRSVSGKSVYNKNLISILCRSIYYLSVNVNAETPVNELMNNMEIVALPDIDMDHCSVTHRQLAFHSLSRDFIPFLVNKAVPFSGCHGNPRLTIFNKNSTAVRGRY